MRISKTSYTLIIITIIMLIASNNNFVRYRLSCAIANVKLKIITKDMNTKKLDNVTYYYSNKSDETSIKSIQEYIKQGEEKTAKLFAYTHLYPYNIVIFTASEKFGEIFKVNPKVSQAVTAVNTLYIPCDNTNAYVFVHEYTHYKMNSFYKGKGIQKFDIPSWFEEGTAEYISSSLFPAKFENPKITSIQDFKKLNTIIQMTKSEQKGLGSYMQGYTAIKAIIDLKGQDSIQKILMGTKSMTFNNSFEKVVGLTLDDFQKLLEKQMKSTNTVEVLLKLGWKYSIQKNFSKAKDTFLEATKKYPYSELAWWNLSLAYTDLGEFNNSIKSLDELLTFSNEKSNTYLKYSQLLITTNLDKALAMAEKSEELAKIEKCGSPKFVLKYLLLIKSLRDSIISDNPFTPYITLIKSDYIYETKLKIDIINHALAKYPNKNDNQKEQLIKLKSDLEKQNNFSK